MKKILFLSILLLQCAPSWTWNSYIHSIYNGKLSLQTIESEMRETIGELKQRLVDQGVMENTKFNLCDKKTMTVLPNEEVIVESLELQIQHGS